MTNTVPPIAANRAFLPDTSLSGDPPADKNKMPVITQRITTTPEAIYNVVCTAALIIPWIVGVFCAKTIVGNIRTPNKIANNVFLFTLYSTGLYFSSETLPADVI